MKLKHLLLALALTTATTAATAGESYQPKNASQLSINQANDTLVVVDAVANGPVERAVTDLEELGLQSAAVFGQLISGMLAVSALPAARQLQSVNQIRINRTITAVGNLTSEGDKALQSDTARQSFNVDGSGITVAVISDSYNCLGGEEADRASNDLPAQTTIVEEAFICDGLVDEGRAIMHLVHDIAPGADLFFLSGTNGHAKTANGILQLANEHNIDIIVDDAKSLAAPFFQKGVLAQAVEQAIQHGVTYVTAAGNSARLSYQSEYRNSYNPALDLNAHDFDPGDATDIFQQVEIPEGKALSLIFQWDSPAFSVSGTTGTTTDLDIHLVDSANQSVLAESIESNLGKDPIEILEFFNPEGSGETEFSLLISKNAGPDPSLVKYIIFSRFDGKISEYHSKSGTIFGHANVKAAITVGAGNFLETPVFGQDSPLLEFFSSAGGETPWLFDDQGNRHTNPISPDKPDVIAPDNVNTELDLGEDTDGDGNPNFRGTSAAAPHVAGVAALMLQANRDLQPRDVKTILELTAVDVTNRNDTDQTFTGVEYDLDSGYGLVDAHRAVSMATTYNASSEVVADSSISESVTVHEAPSSAGAIDPLLTLLIACGLPLYGRRVLINL